MKTLERINTDLFAFEHKGMSITNPIMSDCGRGAIDPAAYGFEVVHTGGGCTAHAQNFILNGERVLMVMTDGNSNAIEPDTMTAEIGIYRAPDPETEWDLLPETMVTFYSVHRPMSAEQVNDLAREALDAAALVIQDKLGIRTGDFAGVYFSGDRLAQALAILADYINAEISEG